VKKRVEVIGTRKHLGGGNYVGPTVNTSFKVTGPLGPISSVSSIILLLVVIALTFGLMIYQLVAASMFVRPLFKDTKKDAETGRYTLTISKHLTNVIKAFTVIFWVILGLSVLSVGEGQKPSLVGVTSNLLKNTSIVSLAITVVVAIGVGFLTAKIYKGKTVSNKVTLNLSKTELVFVKIAIVGEIVLVGLFFLAFVAGLLAAGALLRK